MAIIILIRHLPFQRVKTWIEAEYRNPLGKFPKKQLSMKVGV